MGEIQLNSGKNIAAVIQARMGSTRLPGKVLMDILGKPVLWHVVNRLRYSTLIDKIVIATTTDKKDDVIEEFCKKYNIDSYRGEENDVLDRYYQAARLYKIDPIVRITADCPLIDAQLIDEALGSYINIGSLDYLRTGDTYPAGIGAEVISFPSLEKAWKEARLESEREHVTPYIWKNYNIFRTKTLEMNKDCSHIRVTVDESVDLKVVEAVIESFYSKGKQYFSFQDIVGFLEKNKSIHNLNKHIPKNEGYMKSLLNDREM